MQVSSAPTIEAQTMNPKGSITGEAHRLALDEDHGGEDDQDCAEQADDDVLRAIELDTDGAVHPER